MNIDIEHSIIGWQR